MNPLRLGFCALLFAGMVTATAHAGCGIYGGPALVATPTSYHPSAAAGLRRVQLGLDEPIVGLWQVKITSKGNSDIPDGVTLDEGYSQWHSDGTEILNSGRAPASQSFCLGTWKKVGPFTYRLNHFALSWVKDAKSGDWVLQGPSNIKEEVMVDPVHGHFTGSFSLDDYDTKGKLLAHHTGEVNGKHLTVDSPVAPM